MNNFKLSKGILVDEPTKNLATNSVEDVTKESTLSVVSSKYLSTSNKFLTQAPPESVKGTEVSRLTKLDVGDLKLDENVENENEIKSVIEQETESTSESNSESNSESTKDTEDSASLSTESSSTEASEVTVKTLPPKVEKKRKKTNLWKSRASKRDPIKQQTPISKTRHSERKPTSSLHSIPSSTPKQTPLPSHTPTSLTNTKSSSIPKRMTPFSNDTFQLVFVTSIETFGKSELSLPTNNTLAMFAFFQRHFSFRALVYTNSNRVKRACEVLDIAVDSDYE